VATSATRDASNSAEFAAGVRRILGVDPEVISGADEAYLSFSGATAELGATVELGATAEVGTAAELGTAAERDAAAGPGEAAKAAGPEPPFLAVDIGGGSTEFVFGAAGAGRDDLAAISVDIGCVRLTERHLHGDPPAKAQVDAATADIDAALETVAASVPAARARTLVGLAGSVTTVTALALGLTSYDPALIHHARISAARVHEVTVELLSMNHAQRAAKPVIHPGRIDVIGAGALILDRVAATFGFTEMVASEHDILDGIAWSLVPTAAADHAAP
jgi:exopolyphosphatase/guanosine-5'-triphosphate,3'-diphosphate pyrophosphatase